MEQQTAQLPPPKTTPARRRPKRPVNSPARKTYASENDMPSEAIFPLEFAGPFTPQKSASNSPAPSSQPNHGKSKTRNGNKGRAKQVSSPGPARQGRTTPPHTTNSKPIAAAAFAGATFHASPAPSSLPIPSFLSKALDSPSVQDTDHTAREPSPPATDSEAAPTPQHRLLSGEGNRQESPLDIFFRADRAEKERARRASSANILGPNTNPVSPPSQIRSPAEPRTLPSGLFGAGNRRPVPQRNSSAGIPTSELDGTPGTVIGPALSKPYQERIREARSNKKQGDAAQKHTPSPQDQAAMDMSERLKQFLAIPSMQSGQQPAHVPLGSQPGPTDGPPHPFSSGPHPPHASSFLPPFSVSRPPPSSAPHMPSPFASGAHQPLLATSGPAAMPPPAANGGRSADILHMEDSLRRMLKLNLGPASTGPRPTNYQSS
ncbi:hypothetical protein P885DRAFT_73698 [Corynascus similis CBS 632.67]